MRALALLLISTVAAAAPGRLRMATVVPEGTSWARELNALSRDVQSLTGGELTVKWYFGGLAGSELETIERTRRGLLDGMAGALACERLSPSLQLSRVIGLFDNREEWRYVINRLRPALDRELLDAGFVNLALIGLGSTLLFSRTPVTSMSELQRGRWWVWDLEHLLVDQLGAMGIKADALPTTEAGRAFDEKRTDGFFTTPGAMLGFRWSGRARYFSELHAGFQPGCVLISKRTFDALSLPSQQNLRAAVAKMAAHFEEASREQDRQLLGGVFEKQGLRRVPVSDSLRSAFFEAARVMRASLKPMDGAVLAEVLGWLADFRAEHQDPHK